MKTLSILLVFAITLSCKQKYESVIYSIPSNYEGNVLIIFDQKSGVPPLYENGRRVYEIPSSGVLRTQFSPISLYEVYFRYKDSSEIKYLTSSDSKNKKNDSNEIVICNLEPGEYEPKKDIKLTYQIFSVCSLKSMENIGDKRDDFIWTNILPN